MKRDFVLRIVQTLMVISLLLASCRPGVGPGPTQKTPVSSGTETVKEPNPTPTGLSADLSNLFRSAGAVPPQVVSYLPVQGGEVRPTATFELKFDQAMDTGATQSAFQVTGPTGEVLKGRYAWPSPDHLVFQPEQPLKPASTYEAVLDAEASSHAGAVMMRPFSFRVTTLTPLEVSQVFPAAGVDSVDPTSRITVVFNRPVVPLGIQEDQNKLPQPVRFQPELKGQGEWINTSVYVFTPDEPLKTGSEYTARIAAGLQDATGDEQVKLAKDFVWRFKTRPAGIKSLAAGDYLFDVTDLQYLTDLSPMLSITVEFLQAMDPAGTAKAVELRASDSTLIPFNPQWDKSGRVLTIKPLRYLGLGADYQFTIKASALAADGGTLGQDLNWDFRTVPAPKIVDTDPFDGEKDAPNVLTLRFASPMDTKSIEGKLKFNPPVKNLNWWYSGTNEAFFYGLAPSTAYTVTILPGMLDRYGNAMNTTGTLHFTTAPLPAAAGLLMPYNPLYRVGGERDFYLSYVNIKTVTAQLYRLTAKEYLEAMAGKTPPGEMTLEKSRLVWEQKITSDAKLNQDVQQAISLQTGDGKELTPGFYTLLIDSPEVPHSGAYLEARNLVVTEANVTFKNSPGDSLAWVTDPRSGKPIAGVPLSVYTVDYTLLGKGVTDEDGLLHIDIDSDPQNGYSERYIVSDDSAAKKGVFTFAASSWTSGVYPEDFGIQQNYSYAAFQTSAYVYTDRPIYRPGQPVYFKGIVRQDDDLAYKLPQYQEVEVVISSFEQEINRQTLSVNEFGSFDGQITLDPEAALGAYSISVKPVDSDLWMGGVSFSVAEYRKPEFQIDLQAEPKNLAAGDSFTADLSAAYYSGGPLDNAEVAWNLRSDPYYYLPPAEYLRYSFNDDSRDGGLDVYRQGEDRSKIIAEGRGVTDVDGKLTLKIPAGLPNAADSRQLTMETNITDFSGNLVSAQAMLVAHKAAVYAGVRPAQYVGVVNEAQTFELVTLDWDGKPLTGQKMSVEIMRREWYSVQEEDAQGVLRWKSTVKDVPVTAFKDLTTDDKGLARVQFTPDEGGVYRAVARTTDSAGRSNQAAAYLWVSGNAYIPWRQNNDHTFQLVADRDDYKPGDTAEILIASPYQGSAYALVTVERGKVRSQEVIQLTNNSTIYRLALTPDMAPGVFVSVVVVKGVDDTNPRPGYKIGIAKLKISTEQQALKIDLTPDKKDAGPGDTVTYQVKTTGADGKGVQAEVSLGLSDLATLSLVGPNSMPILDYFYGERGLSVGTALSIAASIEDFNAALKKQVEEGQKAGSGGGKGDDSLGVPEVRQNFPDTAFWKADLVTDKAGAASVAVTLPDNLTTWRMDARAVTADTRVGQTTTDIVSSRPLLVRPQTPRFFVAGDDAELSAAVHNNTGKAVEVKAALQATGAELKGKSEQTLTIAAGKQALVTWKAHVPQDSQRVDLVFSVKGGGYQDASRPTLGTLDGQGIPVYRFEAPETVGTSGELTEQGARIEGIRLPDDIPVTSGKLQIEVEPSLAAGMAAGLSYLEHYPYECAEQTVSRFLPNILTLRALRAAGMEDPELKANLQEQVGVALQKLYSRQNSDGGWGWWSGSKSDPLTSAYVMLALVETQQTDLKVDPGAFDRGISFLTLQSDLAFSTMKAEASSDRNRTAFIDYVLARAGQPNVSRTVQMYDQRKWLDLYALGFLAQTLYSIDPKDPRLETLRSELSNTAVLSATGAHWQEHSADPWNWNTDTRSTAIVLDTLILIDPHNAINTNAVRWLMLSREDGRWSSTQETAWSLKALTDWLVLTNELKADYVYGVALNGKDISESRVNSTNVRETHSVTADITELLKGETNQLAFARTDGPGSMYYTTHLTVDLPVPSVKALDQGMILSRRYLRPADLKTPVTNAAQGELLTVQLTIVAPNDLHYVVIDDPFPAGVEAVDTSLKSSPQNEAPEVNYDWSAANSEGWGWWYFTHAELRDEKLVLSADYLPAGTYIYTYQVRAATPGAYQVIPPTGQEFYFPDVYGRGDGSVFTVK